MKKTSAILRGATAVLTALSLVGRAAAADLFPENFDMEANAHIGTNNGSGVTPVVKLTPNGYPDIVENAGSTEQMLCPVNAPADVANYCTPAFGADASPVPHCQANQWVQAEITAKAGADTMGFDDYPLSPVISNLHVASRTISGHDFANGMDDFQVYGAELTREQVWEIYKRAGRSASPEWRVLTAERAGNPVTFGVTFPSSPEGNYRLFRSPDLQSWLPAAEAVTGTPDALTTSLADPSPPAGKQYYRVQRN